MYAARAMEEPDQSSSSISIPTIREARDLVYSGNTDPAPPRQYEVRADLPARNRKHHSRKYSPFIIVLILICASVISVFYIGNILAVGRLLNQIDQLERKHLQIANDQELLRAQINRLSSLDRIEQIAHDQLGLQKPGQIPVWIAVDPDRLSETEEFMQQQSEQQH